MKILFVAPRFPLPANTGAKIRTYNLLKALSKENEVTLISFSFNGTIECKHIAVLEKQSIKVYLVKNGENINPFAFFSNKPIIVQKYYSLRMVNKINEVLTKEKFDIVHFDHVHMSQYRNAVDNIPAFFDGHNVETGIWNRLMEMKSGVLKYLYKSQADKMQRFEAQTANRFAKRFVVSESDKELLSSISGKRDDIEVLPNGVDTGYFKSTVRSPQSTEDTLVFTGSMDWLPNNDAVEYFCNDILPLIWQRRSSIKFYVVGKNPSKSLLELGKNDKRIVFTGEVEDVRPYIEMAKAFVVPMRIGGGTRLKILEAMAMQKAVVSTTVGAEGIDYIEDINILLADKPKAFADKAVSLLDDQNKAKIMGQNARKFVCDKYDWRIIGKRLTSVYEETINARA